MSKKIAREAMSTQLVAAGNRLHAAQTEEARHPAAVELLILRLNYFSGYEDSGRDAHIRSICGLLRTIDVADLTDWCWAAYQGGMQAMKESYDARSQR